jgi:hypothetical protein
VPELKPQQAQPLLPLPSPLLLLLLLPLQAT